MAGCAQADGVPVMSSCCLPSLWMPSLRQAELISFFTSKLACEYQDVEAADERATKDVICIAGHATGDMCPTDGRRGLVCIAAEEKLSSDLSAVLTRMPLS